MGTGYSQKQTDELRVVFVKQRQFLHLLFDLLFDSGVKGGRFHTSFLIMGHDDSLGGSFPITVMNVLSLPCIPGCLSVSHMWAYCISCSDSLNH